MIVPGTATVNPNTNNVELKAPLGFGTARGVRISNFTADTIILTNISGVDQTQEYLMPQQQMVYKTTNVGRIPTAVGTAYPPAQIAANILVEWSTEPDADFIGTYPVALPAAISSTGGTSLQQSQTGSALTGLIEAGQLPTGAAIISGILRTTTPVDTFAFLAAAEINLATGVVASRAGFLASFAGLNFVAFAFPINLTHTSDLFIQYGVGSSATLAPSSQINVFSVTNTFDIPLLYTDIPTPLRYSYSGTPAAPTAPNPSALEILSVGDEIVSWTEPSMFGVPWTVDFSMLSSATGDVTPGWLEPGIGNPSPNRNNMLAFFSDLDKLTTTAGDWYVGQRQGVVLGAVNDNNPALPPGLSWWYPSTTDTGNISIDVTLQSQAPIHGSYNIQ